MHPSSFPKSMTATARTLAGLVAIVAASTPTNAQPRPRVTDEVRPFIAVDAPMVALTHVRLIDGTGATMRNDQTIVIDGTRILAVGPSATTAIPAQAHVLDRRGFTVVPGFVGLHEHTYFGGVQRLTQMSTSAPLLYLAFGVTTAMTAGSQLPYHELSMQRAIDAGRTPGPQLLIAGPYLDGPESRNPMTRALTSDLEAQRVVGYWADEGVTWVKVMGNMSRARMGAVIRAAHARGVRVTGHLCSVSFAEAAELGIDALQHGFITASEYVPGKKEDECPPDNMRVQSNVDVGSEPVQASIRALARRGTPVVSTLGVYETFAPARFVMDTAALAMLAPETRREVEAANARLGSAGGLTVSPGLLKSMMRWERDFVAAGGLLGAGCDPWGTGYLPGYGDVRNFEMFREAGFSAETAIQIMTYNGARILGMEHDVGAVTVGRQADLVLVRGNPAVSARDLYQVELVFRAGVGYDSQKLRAAARGLVGLR